MDGRGRPASRAALRFAAAARGRRRHPPYRRQTHHGHAGAGRASRHFRGAGEGADARGAAARSLVAAAAQHLRGRGRTHPGQQGRGGAGRRAPAATGRAAAAGAAAGRGAEAGRTADRVAPSGAGDDIRTCGPKTFRRLLESVSPGAQEVPSPPGFEGLWFEQPNGSRFALRMSENYGMTYEVVRNNHPIFRSGFKVHQK